MNMTDAMQHLSQILDLDEEIGEEIVLSYKEKEMSILMDQSPHYILPYFMPVYPYF